MTASANATRQLSPAEVHSARDATPGAGSVIHLNHAGSSLPSESVLATQLDHLKLEASIGGYEAAAQRADAEATVYDSIATMIGANAHEIARHEHATAAWNAGFWSIPMQPGQRIVTARAAYGANGVGFLRAAERRGVTIDVVPDDEHGQVDVAALAERMGDDVALIALTHIPTNGGLVNPAEAVGAIARQADVPYLIDACQSVGQRVLDVAALGCDLLSATGRKYLRGPRGSGFLYASDRIIERLVPDHPDHHGAEWSSPDRYELAPTARRFEYWEYNHAAWLGLGAAVDEAMVLGLDRIQATVTATAERFRNALTADGFAVMDKGQQRCGIVTISTEGFDAAAVKAALVARGVNVSVASPRSTRYDSTERDLGDLLRLSVHYLTTDDELEAGLAALGEEVSAARSGS